MKWRVVTAYEHRLYKVAIEVLGRKEHQPNLFGQGDRLIVALGDGTPVRLARDDFAREASVGHPVATLKWRHNGDEIWEPELPAPELEQLVRKLAAELPTATSTRPRRNQAISVTDRALARRLSRITSGA